MFQNSFPDTTYRNADSDGRDYSGAVVYGSEDTSFLYVRVVNKFDDYGESASSLTVALNEEQVRDLVTHLRIMLGEEVRPVSNSLIERD